MTAPDLPTPDDLARLRKAATRYGFDSLRLLFRAYDAVVAERDEMQAEAEQLASDLDTERRRRAFDALNEKALDESCQGLREALTTARHERDEARVAVRDLLAVADRDAICCTSCSNAAVAIDSNFAYCDEHLSLADGRLRELSYAAAMRRGRAIVAALPPEAGDG